MRRRPAGVTLIAVLLAVSAAVLVFGAVGMLSGPKPARESSEAVLGMSGTAVAAVMLAGFVISSALCQGLLKMQNWARVGTMIVSAVAAIGTVLGLVQAIAIRYAGGAVASAIELAIYVVIFFYMRAQRAAFVTEREERRLAA